MVTAPAWLGAPESEALEYMAADALRDAASLARACVAMLNGGGGTLVVGVDDGGVPRGVTDPPGARDRLQQLLVDRIRPRPLQDAQVRVAPVGSLEVLEVRLKPRPNTLYADRSGGRWGFWCRSGATTRSLDWDEVVARWPTVESRPALAAAAPRWDEGVAERWAGSSAVLVLRSFREQPGLRDRTGQVLPKYQAINALLAGAAASLGQGRIGWQVLRGHLRPEEFRKGEWGQRPSRWGCLGRDLNLRFEGGEHYLAHQQPPKAPWRALYPYAVTEGPASFVNLLGLVGGEFSLVGGLELTMALWTTGGWGLAPGAPDSYGWQFSLPGRDWPPAATDPLQVETRTTWGELRSYPGRVAHRLVSEFYAEFGWDAAAVPFWDGDSEQFGF